MADDFISNLQSLTSNLEEIVFTRFATVIKKNDDHTVDCREDSGTVHKNIKHSNLFNFQVGDTVILGFVDNDLYEPIIVGTRDVDLGVPTTEEIDELITDLNTLTTDMTNLKNSLIRFNGELISFSADNHNLAENLSKLKENLKFVLDDVKILDAGLGEFYDVLESFGIDIDEFVETLMGLNIDLNILQGYLSDFSGTLEQFDAKLRNELDEETYNKLNEDMVKLIWSISQVRGRTTTVEGQARHLADEIGDDTGYDPSTTQPSNLKQWIKWIKWKVGDSNSGMIKDIEALEALIGDDTPGAETGIFADLVTANNHITTINNYIYGNGDAQHPASGSILYQINTLVNTDIPKILTDIYGKPDGTSSDYTANSLYGKLVYMENQLWGNGSSGSPSSDSILGRLGAISNSAGNGRLDLLDKQGGTLDTLDSRINGITNTGGTGRLDNIDKTGGTLDSLDSRIGAITNNSNNGRLDLIDKTGGTLDSLDSRISNITNTSGTGTLDTLEDELGTNDNTKPAYSDNTTLWWKIRNVTSLIGDNSSTPKTGIYLLIDNVNSLVNGITNSNGTGSFDVLIDKLYGLGSDSSSVPYSPSNPKDNTLYARMDGVDSVLGTNEQTTGADTIWGRIRAYLTRLDNISNTSGTGALDELELDVGNVNRTTDGDLQTQVTNLIPKVEYITTTHSSVDISGSTDIAISLTQKGEDYLLDGNTIDVLHITPSLTTSSNISFSSSDIVGQFAKKTITLTEVGLHRFLGGNSVCSVLVGKSDKWEEYDLNSTVFTLFYNPALRLCELRMTYQISGSASGTGEHNVTTPTIPSTYRPSANVIGTLNRGGGSIRVDSSGNIYWITAVTQSVGTYLYGSVMWHY